MQFLVFVDHRQNGPFLRYSTWLGVVTALRNIPRLSLESILGQGVQILFIIQRLLPVSRTLFIVRVLWQPIYRLLFRKERGPSSKSGLYALKYET